MLVRGFRGATTADANTREAILEATAELFDALIRANDIQRDHVASVIFTTTPDLNAEFPAVAARNAGWTDIALMCGHEMSVPGSLQRCVRILMHVNTELAVDQVKHIYLREAQRLRPDLAAANNGGTPQ
jgi:chorismate mutase